MKKILLISFILISCIYGQGQSYVLANTFNTTGTSISDNLIGNGSAFHKLTWNVSGTVSACTVALDSSVDGVSWTVGGVITGQTCTTNGTILSSSAVVNYVRINMTAFSGTGTVTVIDQGFINNPSGGGGSGTVNNCTAAGNAFYSGSGTATNCDTAITDVSGTLNFVQGSIAASAPWLNHTVTWNSGATVFTNFFSNITCTASAVASKSFDWQVNSTSIYSIIYAGANCGLPRFNIPDGTIGNGSFGFGSEASGIGLFKIGASDYCWTNGTNCFFRWTLSSGMRVQSGGALGWANNTNANNSFDTCWDRSAAGTIRADANTGCSDGLGKIQAQAYNTTVNCSGTGTAANPSVVTCLGASSGTVACATAASTGSCQVNTTAVSANSEILITQRTDTTTGTRLSVTCNTTIDTVQRNITAVTAGSSFTFNLGTIATNPECFSYVIIN